MSKKLYEKSKCLKKKLEQSTTIDESIKSLSYDLYALLAHKPDFKNAPIGIKSSPGEKINVDFFAEKERIEMLIDWTLEIHPIILILGDECKLPIEWNVSEDLDVFLNEVYDKYINALNSLPCEQTFEFSKVESIDKFRNMISESLQQSLNGSAGSAYEKFKNAMDYFVNELGDFRGLSLLVDEIRTYDTLFRMRKEENENQFFSKEDMFHVPFEKRGIIGSNRFSLLGFPSLYLGSSLAVCKEELCESSADLESMQAAAIKINDIENVKILDISLPSSVISKRLGFLFELTYKGETSFNFNNLFLLWVLSAACSIKVKNPHDKFKPEYIIPQFLTEWVKCSSEYAGICYMSTKVSTLTAENVGLYKNYVFPIKERKSKGHCPYLTSIFEVSQPKSFYNSNDLLESTYNKVSIYLDESIDKDTEGNPIPYENTDLGKMEAILIRSFRNSDL
ncbi:hypothetical protein ACTXHP_04895 [Bacillus stercoris]|uniref:hypothetical protein n=1 Tax=Bacillus stercoris TaxID=2054641 RepID=UPI00404553E8